MAKKLQIDGVNFPPMPVNCAEAIIELKEAYDAALAVIESVRTKATEMTGYGDKSSFRSDMVFAGEQFLKLLPPKEEI